MKNSVLHQFEESLFEAILKGDRIRLGQQIIIAVSGGKDSLVLLDVLNKMSKTHNFRLFAVTIDKEIPSSPADIYDKS